MIKTDNMKNAKINAIMPNLSRLLLKATVLKIKNNKNPNNKLINDLYWGKFVDIKIKTAIPITDNNKFLNLNFSLFLNIIVFPFKYYPLEILHH